MASKLITTVDRNVGEYIFYNKPTSSFDSTIRLLSHGYDSGTIAEGEMLKVEVVKIEVSPGVFQYGIIELFKGEIVLN